MANLGFQVLYFDHFLIYCLEFNVCSMAVLSVVIGLARSKFFTVLVRLRVSCLPESMLHASFFLPPGFPKEESVPC